MSVDLVDSTHCWCFDLKCARFEQKAMNKRFSSCEEKIVSLEMPLKHFL